MSILPSFKLPIFYNSKKVDLKSNISKDLELVETVDGSGASLYSFAFKPKTMAGEEVMKQISEYYTTDIVFLKESQSLLKKYEPIESNYTVDGMIEIWNDIKNDNGFKEKYQYIDWTIFEYLNKSELFLQVSGLINVVSPLLSFLAPLFILIIPFFIIQLKGIKLTIKEYSDLLLVQLGNHSIGRVFTRFHKAESGERIYILISAGFYLFSIYQNVLSCIRFHHNMMKIHDYYDKIKDYLNKTIRSMEHFLTHFSYLKTYDAFNNDIKSNMIFLKQFLKKLEDNISPYSWSLNKLSELGKIMKYFYDLHDDSEYHNAFTYSFGFNGYIDCISGLKENIITKQIRFAKFKKSRSTTVFKKMYYPSLMNDNPVKNNVKLDKNMIVTGPNASGKTTILKTTIINIIISQQFGCGFYETATLKPYIHLHSYLNIPDTSGRDSLFQAEARRCKEILDDINENSSNETHFCIFDELYSGTNPEDAIASANAFLKYITKYKNVDFMLTTHFIELCHKLKNDKHIENFHMKTEKIGDDFNYIYQLEKGVSDIRGGVKVLDDMNYPKEIIDATRE
jgi:MutS domain V